MDFINRIVLHKTFGEGTVKGIDGDYITVSFANGERKFVFPNAFTGFIQTNDEKLNSCVKEMLQKKQQQKQALLQQNEYEKQAERNREQNKPNTYTYNKKKKEYIRKNIAFKCTYCDGGKTEEQVGFHGVCSDDVIDYNINRAQHVWCCQEDCPCLQYLNGDITRSELEQLMSSEKDKDHICYESAMMRDWRAAAGVIQNGENKGQPMKLNNVQHNSLCILTTRDPYCAENERYIFAAFLVDETYEGDGDEEGYVRTNSEYKIKLSPDEAHSLLYWNYYCNSRKQENPAWGCGLHRYINNEQSAQILKDIALLKKGTKDEELANRFLEHFCEINKMDSNKIPEANGALKK